MPAASTDFLISSVTLSQVSADSPNAAPSLTWTAITSKATCMSEHTSGLLESLQQSRSAACRLAPVHAHKALLHSCGLAANLKSPARLGAAEQGAHQHVVNAACWPRHATPYMPYMPSAALTCICTPVNMHDQIVHSPSHVLPARDYDFVPPAMPPTLHGRSDLTANTASSVIFLVMVPGSRPH